MLPPAPKKRGPPMALRIETPAQNPHIILTIGDTSSANSALSPTTSDSGLSIPSVAPSEKPRSLRNMKKLSITLPSAQSSSNSLAIPNEPASTISQHPPEGLAFPGKPRRPSITSLPSARITTVNTVLAHRSEEEGEAGSPTVAYADGPIQILPGIWIGSEDNARDWKCLMERGIKSILNVAKEVSSPFDSLAPQSAKRYASTPDLRVAAKESNETYYPPHPASGRPGMHYLKCNWSHGQQDLVDNGFPQAMTFVDAALAREEGVLIHCQCGISRSGTLVIALVMRAAAQSHTSVPPEVWALKGMQGAYDFVKSKSRWVGPNMSLIYQLLEYERKLKGSSSPSPSTRSSTTAEEDEEWGRRRQMLEEHSDEDDRESSEVMREARALDKAMEDRIIARKNSSSSMASSISGLGMGAAWRNRYGSGRKRTGSIASNLTTGSILSEDLVEEDEEQTLLGVGGGFDTTDPSRSPSEEADDRTPFTPLTAKPSPSRTPLAQLPPSAPAQRKSFILPPTPATAIRSSFDLPPVPRVPRIRHRPPPLGLLPTVPASPTQVIPVSAPIKGPRPRTESRHPAPPPSHLRSRNPSWSTLGSTCSDLSSSRLPSLASTPSQTLFVFPPSSLPTRAPSTMTLTSNVNAVPFPSLPPTPRVTKTSIHGRPRSFIAIVAPSTPTVASSRVDARGWFGHD